MIYVILILILILFIFSIRNFKQIKLSNVFLVTGAVKSGKSFCSLWLAVKTYKLNCIKWFIKCIFTRKSKRPLKPILYSNIPLANVKYSKLTEDIILRKVRIPNKSVVFIDECSLLIDQMSYKDNLLNEQVSLFVKLFAHYSHGGSLIINTQDLKDVHFGFKRCISQFLYIHSKNRFPFFSVLKVREMLSINDDNVQSVNIVSADLENDLKTVIIPNKYFRYYDCFTFSALTDNKPFNSNANIKTVNKWYYKFIKPVNLKSKYIVSFKKFLSFKNEFEEVKTNEKK